MLAYADRKLSTVNLKVTNKNVAIVIVAAGGYPHAYGKATWMTINEAPTDVDLFQAGTTWYGRGELTTSGRLVIASIAVAETLKGAMEKWYEGVKTIHFDRMQYHKDIGARASNDYWYSNKVKKCES